MILLTHITIALLSIATTTFAYFRPSKTKLRLSYGLVAGTLISGFYLVVNLHAQILQSCLSGLFYLGIVGINIALAQRKLQLNSSVVHRSRED